MPAVYRCRTSGRLFFETPNTDYPIEQFERLNQGDYKIVTRNGHDMLEDGYTTDGNGNVFREDKVAPEPNVAETPLTTPEEPAVKRRGRKPKAQLEPVEASQSAYGAPE